MSVRFLSRKEASDYLSSLGLGIAPTTLAKYATVGGGPRFHRYGRQAKYAIEDLDAWARLRLGMPLDSTSAYETAGAASRKADRSDGDLAPKGEG